MEPVTGFSKRRSSYGVAGENLGLIEKAALREFPMQNAALQKTVRPIGQSTGDLLFLFGARHMCNLNISRVY